jgi:hypothetical protein
MKRTSRFSLSLLLLPVLLLALDGCSEDDDKVTNPYNGEARLRVVHASPDAPAVDVYAEGVDEPLIEDLAYGDASSYLDLDAGSYNIQLRAAGSDAQDPVAYETGELEVPEDAVITAVAVGLLSAVRDEEAFRVLTLVEDFGAAGAGQALVRIVHGGADAPEVALDVANDGDPEVMDFGFSDDTGAAGVALPAGQKLQVGIWAGDPLARVTAFTTPPLPSGAEIFIIATGLLSDLPREESGFSLLAVGPTGSLGFIKQNPRVYALHGSPDAPPVDVWAGGARLIQDLAFSELAGPLQLPPDAYSLDFTAAGNPAVVTSLDTPVLAAGERYLVVASGFLAPGMDEEAFTLLPLAESFADGGPVWLRALHASPDAPPVDLGTVSGGEFTPVSGLGGLGFGESSSVAGFSLPAGPITLGVAPEGGDDPVAVFSVAPQAGQRLLAVAMGSLAGHGESFRLVLVDTAPITWSALSVLPD